MFDLENFMSILKTLLSFSTVAKFVIVQIGGMKERLTLHSCVMHPVGMRLGFARSRCNGTRYPGHLFSQRVYEGFSHR